jgi:DNA-binding response OmpR family regulator
MDNLGEFFRAPTLAPCLLVVEPDVNDAESLTRCFCNLGYRTKWAPNGFDALGHFRVMQPDMVLINSLLPDMYGKQVLEQFQAQRNTLALALVDSHSGDPKSITDASWNDFLFKPLDFTEIAFRVSRLFQGVVNQAAAEQELVAPVSTLCRLGPLRIDSLRQLVTFDQHKIELTQTQFRMLEHLARNPGMSFDRNQLHDVARIKLGYLIETVRGQGYRGWHDPMFLGADPVSRPGLKPQVNSRDGG